MLLPVTFVQINKGLTPGFTLVLAVVMGTERLTLGLILLGSGVSCWQQGALLGFHRFGCPSGMLPLSIKPSVILH
jgi:hypothetical protein